MGEYSIHDPVFAPVMLESCLACWPRDNKL